jgi:hypothetical protein
VRKARAPTCEKQQHWCARNNTDIMQDEQYLAPHKINSNITGEEQQQQEKRNSTNGRRTTIII